MPSAILSSFSGLAICRIPVLLLLLWLPLGRRRSQRRRRLLWALARMPRRIARVRTQLLYCSFGHRVFK